ncbi:MAG TPA: glutamate--tRNA ligase [Candidatus Woesebacteria bacterium]|nr:glutamate--tRNA ligase [Candidatus Woesebacteria bacterium]
MDNPIRTRMAPSPTGELHIGSLRTALYDYALAKQQQGQFILRIEDTDQKRYVPGSDTRLLQVLKDFGLNWDEGPEIGGQYGPYIQTERLPIYQQYLKELIDKGDAYYCFCTEEKLTQAREIQKAAKKIPRYDRCCLKLSPQQVKENLANGIPYVVRMKVPENETLIFNDLVRGEVKFNTNDVDDQVLMKSNGIPTYHFAVVVDDHLMKITHVFRGEEWLPSVPKHILLYRYFGWEMPQHAHLSIFLDPSHPGKMSKRYGTVSAQGFLAEGYLPEAMMNFLMLLGWNPGTEKEIYSLAEFINDFKIERLNKKPAIFDRKKLDYFNGIYIRQLSSEKLFDYFKKFLPQASDDQINILMPVLKERIIKFSDLVSSTKFLFEDLDYSKELLLKKGTDPKLAIEMLTQAKNLFTDFSNLQTRIMDLIKQNNWNTGEFFMVFRVAICGSEYTPPVVDCLPALGQEATIRKIDIALNKLLN